MIRSNIFEKHGRTEIGRQLLIPLRSPVLNTGVTFTIFRGSGNISVWKDKSKTYLRISLNSPKQFLIKLKDISSAPVLLFIFREKKGFL